MARRHLGWSVKSVKSVIFYLYSLRAQAGFVIGDGGVEWNAYG